MQLTDNQLESKHKVDTKSTLFKLHNIISVTKLRFFKNT